MTRKNKVVVDENTQISYSNLLAHITKYHPRTKGDFNEHFKISDQLGMLPFLPSMVNEPTEMAKEIGVGPTLFLMSTRAMAIFCFASV